jgi:hypothetical protein
MIARGRAGAPRRTRAIAQARRASRQAHFEAAKRAAASDRDGQALGPAGILDNSVIAGS